MEQAILIDTKSKIKSPVAEYDNLDYAGRQLTTAHHQWLEPATNKL